MNILNPRQVLYEKLKGLTVQIPNLKPIFDDWHGVQHPRINPWLNSLRPKVKDKLQSLNLSETKLQRYEAADFALFTALWWPEALFEELQILAYFVIWLFAWDDEIDEPTGSYSDDVDAAQVHRAETLQYVHFHLGLSSDETSCCTRSEIIRSADVVCRALRESYTIAQRDRFYQEVVRFMAASEQEQRARLDKRVPTLDEYWEFRLGTSAVSIASAMSEYSMSSNLPNEVMNHGSIRSVCNETNVMISITNDLLSLRKEMKLGCIDNVVTVTFAFTNDIRRAVEESVAALQDSKVRFDKAAQMLLSVAVDDGRTSQQVAKFIEVQRSNCVGNLIWSLQTKRYNLHNLSNQNGTQSFTL